MKDKCINDEYLDFLLYLNAFEMNKHKVYDLFKAIQTGSIELDECYNEVARTYLSLETVMGDPVIALYKLGDIVGSNKLSRFLREYSNVLFTSGDTLTYTNGALKEELGASRAKITESLRVLEILYEAVMVSVLGLSLLVILPIWSLPPVFGFILVWIIGISAYFISLRILHMLYSEIPYWLVALDLVIFTLGFLMVQLDQCYIVYPVTLIISLALLKPILHREILFENELLRVFNDVYSYALLGEPVDIALLKTLNNTNLLGLKAIRFLLLNGYNASSLLKEQNSNTLSRKVMMFLLGTLEYSGVDSTYLVSIRQFIDEVIYVRRFVYEKLRYYILYALILIALIVASYIMIERTSFLYLNTRVLGSYVFLGVLDMSIPVCVIRDRGLSTSRTAVLLVLLAMLVFVFLFNT